MSIIHRLRCLKQIISLVACFGASHRAIHEHDLAKLDMGYRRWMRMVVGPPADTEWVSPWHGRGNADGQVLKMENWNSGSDTSSAMYCVA